MGEKAGSVESITQHKGFIRTPDDLNDYSLEEEEVFGGELEEDAFEVNIYLSVILMQNANIMISLITLSHSLLDRTRWRKMKAVRISS